MDDRRAHRSQTTKYKTYIFEFWIIWFNYGETAERQLTAEQISAVWNEAKFGNLARAISTILGYPFSIVSFCLMKSAQTRARRGE
jgi:hypothetical protein